MVQSFRASLPHASHRKSIWLPRDCRSPTFPPRSTNKPLIRSPHSKRLGLGGIQRPTNTWRHGFDTRTACRGALLALLFLGAALLLTHPLTESLGSALPGNLDDPLLNTWSLGWGAQWLGGGRDLWDAPIFYPHADTFAYSEHLLGISLFVAPVYWLTGNAVLMYNVALLGSFVLAGVGMYLLTAALTGRKDVAIVIALAFACSPIRFGAQLTRLQMLMTGWLPLALWAIHRYAASGQHRYLVGFGISAFLLVLSNTYMLLIGALPIAIVILFEVAHAPGRRWAHARDFGLAPGFVALLLWPVVDKYRDVQETMGFNRGEEEIARYSATLRSYLSVYATTDWLPWVYPEQTADRALYTGGTVLLLAGAALMTLTSNCVRKLASRMRRGRFRDARPAFAIGDAGTNRFTCYLLLTIAAVTLSFGPVVRDWQGDPIGRGPYYGLQQLLPGIDGLRAPARFGLVAAIGLGVIAGFGATSLLASSPAARRRIVLMTATLFVLVEAWPVGFTIEPFGASGRPGDQPLYTWLRQQAASSMVELPSSRHMAVGPNRALIYQYETLNHPHALVNGSSGFHSPLADLIEGDTSPFRDPTLIADAVLMLQTIAVRYVAVHTADYEDPEFAAQVVNALRTAPGLAAHRQVRFQPSL